METKNMPTPPQRRTLTLEEFANEIGISYHTAYRWQKAGRVRVVQGLRKLLVPTTEVERILREAK